ncbi:ATP-binding protein [Sutcliffiella halmapala]|uniref:ATP-binding protein n=1 Tax=Sutcliffiella halmapala TaxID=79882 RepID=UPI000995BC8B|nr:ATP-binding protein [Sutcliffiella halmapala]
MEFILILAISTIPMLISFSILFFSNTSLTKALSLFLLMLSFWQIDIALLYANNLLKMELIDPLFRVFRMGSIFIMPIMYYFSYNIVKQNEALQRWRLLFNKTGFYLVIGLSVFVYLINFTPLGVESYRLNVETPLSPSHLVPIYGTFNFFFIINILMVFVISLLLLLLTLKLSDYYYKSFYIKLVCAAMLIFVNGVMSGFIKIPLYFSSFNSIFAAVILFIGFFQMQSLRLNGVNRKLERQSEWLESIMNINPNYLLVKNRHNRISEVNDSFCQLFDMRRENVIGRDFSELAIYPQMMKVGSNELHRFVDDKGKVHYIKWGSKDLHQNVIGTHTLCFGIDVTEQKKNEQLLLSSEKLKVIGDMAASVAHEIRNPLTSIRGFIQLYKERSTNPQYENIVIEEIDRIDDVLKELLILAKPEAKEKKEKSDVPIDIFSEVNNINLLFHALAKEQEKNLELVNRLQEAIFVALDKDHLKQVLINILKNSFEVINKDGHVKVILDKQNSFVRIRVLDNGVGISPKRLTRIGEPYYSSKEKGTGIGLTICFKLVKENGGQMWVKSRKEKGTIVTILFPVSSKSDYVS